MASFFLTIFVLVLFCGRILVRLSYARRGGEGGWVCTLIFFVRVIYIQFVIVWLLRDMLPKAAWIFVLFLCRGFRGEWGIIL